MKKITLPYRHYYYLNFLSTLRRVTHHEAIEYLYENVDENSDNWIDVRYEHFNKPPKEIDVESVRYPVKEDSLMKRIQGLPPEIRPVTDGPYCLNVEFEENPDYIVLNLSGYKIYDYKEHRNIKRVSRIFPLVKDRFPFTMTLDQYGVYRDAGSQFWRLTQERDRETMPAKGEIAMDVGAHIGYRALAMHHCVGPKGKVYAIEVEDENFELLKKNIEMNNLTNMIPIHEAVDEISQVTTLFSRDKKSMAHGLRKFEDIEDPSAIDRPHNRTQYTKKVTSLTLDDLFEKYQIDRVDNMHISVTGYEIEVLKGINTILPRLSRLHVSCPYKTHGIPNIDTAEGILREKGFVDFNRVGSAVISDLDKVGVEG